VGGVISAREELRAAGLCTTCGACPPSGGRLQCDGCRSRINVARNRRLGRSPETGADATLGEVGAAIGGVTRERARQLQARALKKLRSPAHRARVQSELVEAVRELRRVRARGVPIAEEYAAARAVEDLTDALEWLDAYAKSELSDPLEHADNVWDAIARCA
jgi:hypothetical protein